MTMTNRMAEYELLARRLVPDEMWAVVERLLPPPRIRPQGGGRSRVDSRSVFVAIVWIVSSGVAWRQLPGFFGVASPTMYRRFWGLVDAKFWHELREAASDDRDWCEWARQLADAAERRAETTGPSTGRV